MSGIFRLIHLLLINLLVYIDLKLEQLQKASSFQHPSIHQMDSLPHSLPHSSHTGSIPTGDTHPAASMQPHPQSVIPPSSQQLHTTNSLPSNTQFNGMHHQLTAVGPSGKPSSVQFTQLPQQTGPANYQGNLLPGQQRHYSSLSDQYVHNPNTYSHKKIQSRQTAGKQFVQPESIHNTPTSRGNNTLLSPTQCQSMYNRSHGQEEILLDHTQQSALPHCIPQGMNPPQVYSPSHYQPLSPVRSPVAYEQPQTWQPQEQHHYGNNPVSPYRSIQHGGGGVGNQQYISDVPLTSGCGQVMMLPDPEQPCGQIVLARSSNVSQFSHQLGLFRKFLKYFSFFDLLYSNKI